MGNKINPIRLEEVKEEIFVYLQKEKLEDGNFFEKILFLLTCLTKYHFSKREISTRMRAIALGY